MPRNRRYETNADRQRAYRERVQLRRLKREHWPPQWRRSATWKIDELEYLAAREDELRRQLERTPDMDA